MFKMMISRKYRQVKKLGKSIKSKRNLHMKYLNSSICQRFCFRKRDRKMKRYKVLVQSTLDKFSKDLKILIHKHSFSAIGKENHSGILAHRKSLPRFMKNHLT